MVPYTDLPRGESLTWFHGVTVHHQDFPSESLKLEEQSPGHHRRSPYELLLGLFTTDGEGYAVSTSDRSVRQKSFEVGERLIRVG